MTKPLYINIEQDRFIRVQESLPENLRCSLYGIMKRAWERETLYDSQGTKYRVEPAEPVAEFGLLKRILVATVYNPRRMVSFRYLKVGTYQLEDLKKHLRQCIENDDDILTQHHTAAEIIKRLGEAKDFEDIIRVIHWLQ